MSPGDIVASPTGDLWRVTRVNEGVVHVVHVERGGRTSFPIDDVRLYERHPGGRGAA